MWLIYVLCALTWVLLIGGFILLSKGKKKAILIIALGQVIGIVQFPIALYILFC